MFHLAVTQADSLRYIKKGRACLIARPSSATNQIPDSAPPLNPDEQVIAPSLANSFATERVRSAVDSMHRRLSEIETMAAEMIKSGMDRIQTPEMKSALTTTVEQNSVLIDVLPTIAGITKSSKDVLKALQTAQNSRKQTLSQIRAALDPFATE